MSAKDELQKMSARGQEPSSAEAKLEEAREAFHKDRSSESARKAYRKAQDKVAEERVAARLEREAAGPPEVAEGDAVVRPGGVS